MNKNNLTRKAIKTIQSNATEPKTTVMFRKLLIYVLSHASEGHFILKENGRVIAEVGDKNDVLQAEVEVLNTRLYGRALIGGNTAAGKAFVDGWWTSPNITQVTRFFARNLEMMDYWSSHFGWLLKPFCLLRLLCRLNTKSQAKKNILAHYDLGNGLYQSFLDPKMQYSSAIYNNGQESLTDAQENKLVRLCEQLKLTEDDHLLEVGSGWGGLAIFAATNYGCKVTTTTISEAQYVFAQKLIKAKGLECKITLLNQDYRLLTGEFDKIISVEMIEAVGKKYLPNFFGKLNSLLKPNGLLMLQAITIGDQRFSDYSRNEDFIQKHIFPGGFLPSMGLIAKITTNRTDLVIRDVLDIGQDYAQTLAHWRHAFLDKQSQVLELGYDNRFINLWVYYFGYCEGGFLEKRVSAVHVLASKAPHHF
jgi:cyclopropane-fatty-acyl-phospholipid synthase